MRLLLMLLILLGGCGSVQEVQKSVQDNSLSVTNKEVIDRITVQLLDYESGGIVTNCYFLKER